MFVFVNSFAFVCVFVFVTAAREEWNQGCVTIGGVSHPQFSRPLNIIARQALSETVTNQIEGRCKCRVTQVTFSGLILTLERFLPCPLRILTFFDRFMISPILESLDSEWRYRVSSFFTEPSLFPLKGQE